MKQMNVRAEAALLEVARRHHTTVEEVRREIRLAMAMAMAMALALALALQHPSKAHQDVKTNQHPDIPEALRLSRFQSRSQLLSTSSCRHDERSCVSCLSPDKKGSRSSLWLSRGLVRQTNTNCLWSYSTC